MILTSYQWRQGSRISGCSADAAAEVLEQLRKTGPLTAQRVTEAAADPNCPLHQIKQYMWDDDSAAAQEHRKQVSRRVLRSIILVSRDDSGRKNQVHQYVLTQAPKKDREYQRIDVVVNDQRLMIASLSFAREQLTRAHRAMLSLKKAQQQREQIEQLFRALFDLIDAAA